MGRRLHTGGASEKEPPQRKKKSRKKKSIPEGNFFAARRFLGRGSEKSVGPQGCKGTRKEKRGIPHSAPKRTRHRGGKEKGLPPPQSYPFFPLGKGENKTPVGKLLMTYISEKTSLWNGLL